MASNNKSVIDCERFFRRLQTKLSTCWQPLATHCGFDSDKIKAIRVMNDDPEEQAFDILCMLRKRSPDDWAKILMEGLMLPAVGRQDVLDDVKQFLREGRATLKPITNVARSAGPSTRTRSRQNSHQPLKSQLIRIRDIKPKLVSNTDNWCIKAWADLMYNDEPQVDEDKSYFHCRMSDGSGMKIYISFFFCDSQKCEDVYKKIARSRRDNPVFLSSMRLEKQKEKYKKSQCSNYRLIFNDDSEITRS